MFALFAQLFAPGIFRATGSWVYDREPDPRVAARIRGWEAFTGQTIVVDGGVSAV
jgi:hypothetical protein